MEVSIVETSKNKVTSYDQSLRLARAGFRSLRVDSWWNFKDKTLIQNVSVSFSVNGKEYVKTTWDGELEEVIPAYRLDTLLEFSPENDIDDMLAKAVEMIVSQCDGNNGAAGVGGLDDEF